MNTIPIIKHIHLNSCASTNDEAWKIAPETVLVTSLHQTAGRGRQGRTWNSAPGNVFASLSIQPGAIPPDRVLWTTLAAGVAAVESTFEWCKASAIGTNALAPLTLKWPNDLLWVNNQCRAKLAGILCESKIQNQTVEGLVVGIGYNLNSNPSVPEQSTISLRQIMEELSVNSAAFPTPQEFATDWATRMLHYFSAISNGDLNQVQERWKLFGEQPINFGSNHGFRDLWNRINRQS